MQSESPPAIPRRSNPDRTRATREALLAAARQAFVRKGFAATSTPEIVAAAGVTRGALYHHFQDKGGLFQALLEEEARAVARRIEAAADGSHSPREALMAGALAYLDAMTTAGRTRLLLVEGPAVLGPTAMRALDEANAERTLVEGLAAAIAEAAACRLPANRQDASRQPRRRAAQPAVVDAQDVAAYAVLLSAAFDRAALAIDEGGDAERYRAAMLALLEAVLDRPVPAPAPGTAPRRGK
jgi:AcrR family transcriptional regulator